MEAWFGKRSTAGIGMPRSSSRSYVLCVRNGTYRASLQPRKVYSVVEDPRRKRVRSFG
jgi:hypothetical protein